MSETQRDSRYELLRMLAMFAIVLYHFMGVNGGNVERELIQYAVLIFGSGGKIAVNIFLIISCWFMVDKPFKAERVVRAWYTVVSYAVPISAAMLLLHPSLGNAACLLKSCFPVFARPLWFASAYILLMLLEPFLNRMIQGIGKRQHAALTITLLIPCCLAATIMFHDDFLNSLIWFIVVYIFVSYVKRYWRDQMPKKSGLHFSAAFLLYLALCTTGFALGNPGMNLFGGKLTPLSTFAYHWLSDIKSIPNFLCAMLIFLGFSGLKRCNVGGVSAISSSTLSVYVIHQIPSLYDALCEQVCYLTVGVNENVYPAFMVAICALFFVTCVAVDKAKKKWVDPHLKKMFHFDSLCQKLDRIFAIHEDAGSAAAWENNDIPH